MAKPKTKKILVVCFDLPYPDNFGGAKDVWNRLTYLNSIGYSIDLLASCSSIDRIAAFHEKNSQTKTVDKTVIIARSFGWAKAAAQLLPFSLAWRSVNGADRAKIRHELAGQKYDVVLIEQLKSLSIYDFVSKLIRTNTTHLRSHNIESLFYSRLARAEPFGWKSIFFRVESLLYRRLEARFLNKRSIDKVLYISSEDMQLERCVDSERRYWLPTWFVVDPARADDYSRREDILLYVGNLDSLDNVQSVDRIAEIISPLLDERVIRFVVAGRKRDYSGASLFADARIECLPNITNDKLIQLYARAKLFFCFSLNDAGVKTKLLEAVARNLPTLANREGAAGSGLEDSIFCLEYGSSGVAEALRFIREMMHSKEKWLKYQQAQSSAVFKFWAVVEARHRDVFCG